jgi:hypothetical protein
MPGQSGNPSGRPAGERRLLATMYGDDGRLLYTHLEQLRVDTKTPIKLKVHINEFLIERLHGRSQQRLELRGAAGLTLEEAITTAARSREDREL